MNYCFGNELLLLWLSLPLKNLLAKTELLVSHHTLQNIFDATTAWCKLLALTSGQTQRGGRFPWEKRIFLQVPQRQRKDINCQVKSRNLIFWIAVIIIWFVCASSAVRPRVGVPIFSSPRFVTPKISRTRERSRFYCSVENSTIPGRITCCNCVKETHENCMNQHPCHTQAEWPQGQSKNYTLRRPRLNSLPSRKSSIEAAESFHYGDRLNPKK